MKKEPAYGPMGIAFAILFGVILIVNQFSITTSSEKAIFPTLEKQRANQQVRQKPIKNNKGWGFHVGPRMTTKGFRVGPGFDFAF